MNIELKSKEEQQSTPDLTEAQQKRQAGDDELKTSCLMCKFKPNFLDAIPYYKNASQLYHSARAFRDEIYCREKLAYCLRENKSKWEEGNEYDQLASIYLDYLNDPQGAWKAINNAYQAYFRSNEYKDAVDCVRKLGEKFKAKDSDESLNKEYSEYAEKCLKQGYDAFLQIFHLFASKKEEPYGFLYTALDSYIAILISGNKIKHCLPALITDSITDI